MSFGHPILFALGAAFVALPIVLHFLRRRRPPVMWGAMRFLVEAYKRRRRRMTLEQLLLLLCRCGLVLAVALLVGQPLLGNASRTAGPREVFLVIDNSIASASATERGIALDRFKAQAESILDELDPAAGDRAALITIAGPAEGVILPPSGDLGAVRRRLLDIEPQASAADVAGGISLASSGDADVAPAGRTVMLFSELLTGSTPTGVSLPPLPAAFEQLIVAKPATAGRANIAIREVRPLRSTVIGEGRIGGQAMVHLERSGTPELAGVDADVEVWAKDGAQLGTGRIVFEPGQSTATGLVWFQAPEASGDEALVLETRLIVDDDAIDIDNIAWTPIHRRDSIDVGVIARRSLVGQATLDRFDAADWIRIAISPEIDTRTIRIVDVTPAGVDAPRLSTLDAAILLEPDSLDPQAWQDLRHFVDQGGLLLVTPSATETVQLWTDSFTDSMDLEWMIDRQSVEVEDALAPQLVGAESEAGLLGMLAGEFEVLSVGVGISQIVRTEPAGANVELRTQNGDAFLMTGVPGSDSSDDGSPRGLVAFLASSPSPAWTDLPATPLMVPLLQEIVRQGVGRAVGGSTAIAGRIDAEQGLTPIPALGSPANDRAPISGPVRRAGVFRTTERQDRGTGVLAVNPDVSGSDMNPMEAARLEAWLRRAAGEPTSGSDRLAWLDTEGEVRVATGARPTSDNTNLALVLATLAGLFALAETLLARSASRGMTAGDLAGSAAP